MLSNMPASVLYHWQKLYRAEPWGEYIEELRTGALRAALINPNLRRGHPPMTAQDCMVTIAPPPKPELSVSQLWAKATGERHRP